MASLTSSFRLLSAITGVLILVVAGSCHQAPGPPDSKGKAGTPSPKELRILLPSGFSIQIEVARSDEERALGLMFRDNLPWGRGMLFIFSGDEIHSFWMKNTKIPLDLLWLDEDGRIIFLLEDVPPCLEDPCPSYGSMQKARYVLELKAGMCKLENLGPGSRLVLPGNI